MLESNEIPDRGYVTYVKNPPENIRSILCENVFTDMNSGRYWARVYRPLATGEPLPVMVKFWLYDTYTMIKYDDGCICYCYKTDNPIDAHRHLERYSDNDMFRLANDVAITLRSASDK